MSLWNWIRSVGGNRDAEADEREEYGGSDPGEAEETRWAGSGLHAAGAAADVAEEDLSEFEPPRDPAP